MATRLPPDIDQRVKACLTGGVYQNEDEVLRQAMDALEEREQEKLHRWHERNQIAIEQSRLGQSTPLDIEAMLERIEERAAQQNQAG